MILSKMILSKSLFFFFFLLFIFIFGAILNVRSKEIRCITMPKLLIAKVICKEQKVKQVM